MTISGSDDKRTSNLQVQRLEIEGNESFSTEEILNLFSTRETPWWGTQIAFSLFGDKIGSPPSYFESVAFDADVERLKNYYRENGFPDIEILHDLKKNITKQTITISLKINEHSPLRVDSVVFLGVEDIDSTLRNEILSHSILKKNARFVNSDVNREVNRILTLFQDNGYPHAEFVKDSSSLSRYVSTNSIVARLYFIHKKKFTFGSLTFDITQHSNDTVSREVFIKQIGIAKGELFSNEKRARGERNLNRLGIFEAARIDAQFPQDGNKAFEIPLTVVGKLRPKHDIAPELSLSDENNAFNIGLGGGYTDRNFYGEARNFRSRLIFRFQSLQTWNFQKLALRERSVVGSIDLTFSVSQPYVFMQSLTGNTSVTFRVEKQREYIQNIIRSNLGFTNQFAAFTQGFFEWSLERSQVEFLSDSSKRASQNILEQEDTKPQFNSILSGTLQRDKTNDIFSPTKGFFHSITMEESGVLPLLVRNLQPDLPFTQYYKITMLGRWYFETGKNKFSTLAFKLKTGYQNKYGESYSNSERLIPLNRRFFSGGSGSVRGWRSRELGAMNKDLLPLGGNVLFETNIEERINVFKGFGKFWFVDVSHIWTVFFLDAGTVWRKERDIQLSDIAVATGFGIRYDTFFGPFRFDIGYKAYDPNEHKGKQTIFQKKFFGETFKHAVYHFGIGHAF
ncbi:MAG: hypothetical protein FJ218_04165 [Ignavibacteria bacterium]|nr:hypothetical protein [Ignavibacteria bacterium]